MKYSTGVLGISLLVLDILATGWCLQCFECKDTPKPFQCDTVTTCPPNNECIVRQKITTGGLILYDSGCASVRECSANRKRHARHLTREAWLDTREAWPDTREAWLDTIDLGHVTQEAESDIFSCLECCNDTDFCNVQGCGIKDLSRSQRGPYCFTCHIQGDKNTCRSVTQCGLGEECVLRDTSRNGVVQFRSECIPETECNSMLSRRSTVVDRCPKCCTQDFCNNDCIHDPSHAVVNGGFNDWGPWGTCSASCGDYAVQQRSRTCTNPAPANGGADCDGSVKETKYCDAVSCTGTPPARVDGRFTNWTHWGPCSTTCGSGIRQQSRTCTNPPPAHGGANCTGPWYKFSECPHHHSCSTEATKTTTTITTLKTTTTTSKTTTTTTATPKITTTTTTAAPATRAPAEPGHWSHWNRCTSTCGSRGVQTRTRNCHELPHCTRTETRDCNRIICPDKCTTVPQYRFDRRNHVCWKLYPEQVTWQNARDRCVQDGADLVVVDTLQKDNLLYGLMHSHFKTETHPIAVWMGLHGQNNNHWRWVHTFEAIYNGKTDTYSNFNNVTAEFTGDHQYDCALHVTLPAHVHNASLAGNHYAWIHRDCNEAHYFVCEKFLH